MDEYKNHFFLGVLVCFKELMLQDEAIIAKEILAGLYGEIDDFVKFAYSTGNDEDANVANWLIESGVYQGDVNELL